MSAATGNSFQGLDAQPDIGVGVQRQTDTLRCRCMWRGERCENQATEEDGLCNWCGNGRSSARLRLDRRAIESDGKVFIGGAGQTHDYDPSKPSTTSACWLSTSDRTVLDAT